MYTIIGDTKEHKDCLVRVVYGDIEVAKESLAKLQKDGFKDFTNFRIVEEKKEDCWWNDPFLCN